MVLQGDSLLALILQFNIIIYFHFFTEIVITPIFVTSHSRNITENKIFKIVLFFKCQQAILLAFSLLATSLGSCVCQY